MGLSVSGDHMLVNFNRLIYLAAACSVTVNSGTALRKIHVNGRHDSVELYDLASDVGEERNIADQYLWMVKWFDRYMQEARTPSAHWPSPLDP